MKPRRYVSFSYLNNLSRVNLGGKVVHWTRTLSHDSCSRYEPFHLTTLFPFFSISFIGLSNWVGDEEENAKCRGTYAEATCISPSPAGPPSSCPLHLPHLLSLSFVIGMPNNCCIRQLRADQCFVCNFLRLPRPMFCMQLS